jgi:hypothetical protein
MMVDTIQTLMEQLTDSGFFTIGGVLSDDECTRITSLVLTYSKDLVASQGGGNIDDVLKSMTQQKNKKSTVSINTNDLYMIVNAVMAPHGIEGKVLLRVSRMATGLFAFFMGFVAMFLQVIGFGIGWVYMSMGVLIGSAVGPATLTLLMERANGFWIGAGAVGGLVIGLLSWCLKGFVDTGEVSYESIGADWPWVVGNVCSIGFGFLIAFVGSMLQPNKKFKWEMLNDQIPLVDDIEPLRDAGETEEMLQIWHYVAVTKSLGLTATLIVLWPMPMYFSGVFTPAGFTVWTFLSILWIVVAAIVILGLPMWEIYSAYIKNKATAEALANADAKVISVIDKVKINKGAAALAAEAVEKEQALAAEAARAAAALAATSSTTAKSGALTPKKGAASPKSGATTPKKGTPKSAASPKKAPTPV